MHNFLDWNIRYKIKISFILIFINTILSLLIESKVGIQIAAVLNVYLPILIFTKFYLSVPKKFFLSLLTGTIWAFFSYHVAQKWIVELSELSSASIALFIIFGIAIIPGFMNAFMISSLLLDVRPPRKKYEGRYPNVTVLVAAYNEGENIISTIESIGRQKYPGLLNCIIINDGSKDDTAKKVKSQLRGRPWLRLLNLKQNVGKADALNKGLAIVDTELTITIDGDSYLYKDAIQRLVERYMSDPAGTAAVAGAVLVRNSRNNLVTRIQEWDYFHGIASIKRIQSLYQGTLVAQGAFSLYSTAVLRDIKGWPKCVGEDIVVTWNILNKGYRVGFAEDACLFTNAPETWKQFIKQRQRWSRGLIEAFKTNWRMLFKKRMITLFIWWNLLFPYMDIVYTFAFIPGLMIALFGYYWIAGPLTLLVLPLAMVINWIMFAIQSSMFLEQGLKVRKNIFGFIIYSLFYSIILQPACVLGYIHEIFKGSKKSWGTK